MSEQDKQAQALEEAKLAARETTGSVSKNSLLDKQDQITDASFLLDYSLADSQGTTLLVSESLEEITLVNFWATWCAPCRAEMPIFNEMYQKYQAQGFGVLGLTIDNLASTQDFVSQLGIKYPILMAENEGWDLLTQTGNPKNLMPYSFLIDREGKILEKKLGTLHAEEIEIWIDKYL